MLHKAQPRVACMKTSVRGYVWWLGIDKETEQFVKLCEMCEVIWKSVTVAPLHSWLLPDKLWMRVHIDYVRTFPWKDVFNLDRRTFRMDNSVHDKLSNILIHY